MGHCKNDAAVRRDGSETLTHLCRLLGWGVLVLGALLGSPSVAQDGFDTSVEFTGKLKAARRNMLVVTRDDGTEVQVMAHADPTRLTFTAKALPQAVRPGMLARVQTMLGPTGQPTAPIETIELFAPFQPSRESSVPREYFMPGIYSAETNQALQPNRGVQPGAYRIVGMIVGMQGNYLGVNTGQVQVMLPVAAEAKWEIRFHDLSLAQEGDSVHVGGFYKAPDETQIKAANIRVETERVIGEQPENPRAARKPRRERNAKPAQEKKPDPFADVPGAQ